MDSILQLRAPPNLFSIETPLLGNKYRNQAFYRCFGQQCSPVENSLVYYIALRKAGVPVEMHLYAHGGHAFGLRRTEAAITAWPELVDRWLKTIGTTSN